VNNSIGGLNPPTSTYLFKKMNPFQRTLSLIQERLNSDLPEGYRRIWVEGNNKNSIRLCITLFPIRGNYTFIFHDIKNFRNVKDDMDELMVNQIISEYEGLIRNLISP